MNTVVHAAVKNNKRNWLVGIFFLSCLFPFVSPVPIETDTQPLFLIFGAIIVARRIFYFGLDSNKFILLFCSILSLIYINPFLDYRVDLGKSLSIVAGVLTFIAIKQIGDQQAYRLLKKAAIVYFLYSCLIYLNPSFFLGLQENFVRAVNVADMKNLAYRGAPALATEPGLLGGLLVFLLIQLDYYSKRLNASVKERVIYGLVIILTILMTKSGTGYLYLVIFFILTYSHRLDLMNWFVRIWLLPMALIFLVLLIPVIANIELNNRGVQILVMLASGGSLETDTSVLKRVFDIQIGIRSLFDYPFGVGINGVFATVNEVASRHNLLRANDFGNQISLVSGLAYYLVAYGVFGLIFVIYVFFIISRAPFSHKVFAFIYLASSFSPAFPAIWILLSQSYTKK